MSKGTIYLKQPFMLPELQQMVSRVELQDDVTYVYDEFGIHVTLPEGMIVFFPYGNIAAAVFDPQVTPNADSQTTDSVSERTTP